ncbi:MAG: fibronectin type III domain-containing protein [Actinomycetota bacterium]|nr:fibronectin type III domain-containing protein [Actinomycetota bacterium]
MTHRPGLVRRAIGAAAAVGVGILLVAPHALADNRGPISSGPWEGSKIDTPERVAITNQVLGAIIRDPNPLSNPTVTATFSRAPGIPGECAVDASPVYRDPGSSTSYLVNTSVDCNGAYPFTFDATVANLPTRSTMPQLSGTLIVEVPPAAVSGVTATVVEGTRNVSVKWTPSTGTAPDFLGYKVQRRLGSKEWATVTTVGPTAKAFVDNDVPAEGGEYAYRVLGRRAGVPDEVLSAQGTVDKVTLPEGTPDTSTSIPGDGSSTTVPGTPPGDGTTVPGGSVDGGTTPPTGKPNVIKGSNRPRVTTRAPNLGAPAQSNLGILLNRPAGLADEDDEGDGGYNEALPFGDPSIDGSLADDEESGSSIFYSGERRGLAIPVATGFVLFAWAIHLRFLARASRPEAAGTQAQYYDDPFDPFYDPML